MVKSIIVALALFPLLASADAGVHTYKIESTALDVTWEASSWAHGKAKDDTLVDVVNRRTCAHAGFNKCPSFAGTAQGTGFLIAQGDTIITALHTFGPYLRALWEVDPNTSDIEVPVVITAEGGKVVFGKNKDDVARLTMLNPAARDAVAADTLNSNPDLDFAYLRLSHSIGSPVRVASGDVSAGQPVSDIGFQVYGGDATVSETGVVLQKPSSPYCQISPSGWEKIEYATYQDHKGVSGGPVFNQNSEVVGLHLGVCQSPDGAPLSFFVPLNRVLPKN